ARRPALVSARIQSGGQDTRGSPRRLGSGVGRRALSSRVIIDRPILQKAITLTSTLASIRTNEVGDRPCRHESDVALWRRGSSAEDREQLFFLSMPDGSRIQ